MTSPRLLTHHNDGEKSAVIWREQDDAGPPPLDYFHNGSFRGLGEGGGLACSGGSAAPRRILAARRKFGGQTLSMSRMNWLLHPAYSFFASIALFYLFLLNACGREDVRTTNYVATISVNGHNYTADVVGQKKFSILNNKYMPSPYGRVLTFRLQDDRVIVLNAREWGHVLKCVPRLDQSDTGCKQRWPYSDSHLRPDGYVFNSATDPTSAEAFQFQPRDQVFAAKARYDLLQLRRVPLSVPVSNLLIEMVSYAETASQERRPRDTLDRDFPGYDLTRFRDGKRVSDTNEALNQAADHAGVPLAKDRR